MRAIALGKRVIMPIGIKAKKAALKHASRSHIEVTSITRTHPFIWVAKVEYTYRSTSWEESVKFAVEGMVGRRRTVYVNDVDYPGDRGLTMHLSQHDSRDMAQVILDFLITGRW